MNEADDAALAEAAARGDARAFAVLMRRHRDAIYRLVRAHVGDGDEARDVTQEAFLAAWRAIDRYDPARPMRGWLAAIAINKCRDWGRRRRVRRWLAAPWPIGTMAEQQAADVPGVDVMAGDRAELRHVAAAMAALPPTLKEPLILRTIEGCSQAETAAVLGISAKAVETRLARARTKLAAMVARTGD